MFSRTLTRVSLSTLRNNNSNNASLFGTTATKTAARKFGYNSLQPSHFQENFAGPSRRRLFLNRLGTATVLGCVVGQYYYGHQKDFFDYRFITTKDPDDLAGFYGGEEFMELFCVLPFMGTLMMRGGHFDDDGTVHTTGLPGEMQVSMVFSDEQDDDGKIKWFNKRERFKDVFMGYTCWDMVTNFGFERLPDGRVMVYHHGEYFDSSFPPFSLIVRFVFGFHSRWVAWAADHHINHYAFVENENELEEAWEEESRADMPLFLIKNYAWSDLMAALFGRKIEKPSFMLQEAAEAAAVLSDEEDDTEFDDAELPAQRSVIKRRLTADIALDRKNSKADHHEVELPLQRSVIRRRVTADIALDRNNSKLILLESSISNDNADEGHDVLKRSNTTTNEKKSHVALDRRHSLIAHHRTNSGTNKDADESDETAHGIQRHVSLARENLGGHSAWEMLRSTNNPEVYKAATLAAKQRFSQRRESLRTTQQPDESLEPPVKSADIVEGKKDPHPTTRSTGFLSTIMSKSKPKPKTDEAMGSSVDDEAPHLKNQQQEETQETREQRQE